MNISEIIKWLEDNDFKNGVQGEVNQAIYHLRRANENAAQQSVQPTVLKHAQFCASRGQGGGACDCQPANTHSG